MTFRIGHGKAQTMVGASFDARNFQTLRDQVLAQCSDVVSGKRDVIHAVSSFGIGSSTVSHPLLADQVSHESAGLHRRGGGEPESAAVESFHSVRLRSVEGNVVDPEDMRPVDAVSLRVGTDYKKAKCERREELFHKALILAQAGLSTVVARAAPEIAAAVGPHPPAVPRASNVRPSESRATGCRKCAAASVPLRSRRSEYLPLQSQSAWAH